MASLSTLAPDVISAMFLRNLRHSLVYRNVCDTRFMADVAQYGDSVAVPVIERPSIREYTPGTDYTIDAGGTGTTTVNINQAKYFAESVDLVHLRQARPNPIPELVSEGAYAVANDIDQYVAGLHSSLTTTTAGPGRTDLGKYELATTGNSVYNALLRCREQLTRNGVVPRGSMNPQSPDGNLWVVLPPELCTRLLSDSNLGLRASGFGDQATVNGYIGLLAGFMVFESVNVPFEDNTQSDTDDVYRVMAGITRGMSLVIQIQDTKMIEMEKQYGMQISALTVYGAAITLPGSVVRISIEP